jgi:hypothetical protein
MQVSHCTNCGKSTGHKRNIGVGTLLGALVTGGVSLAAVPFYPKRCIACGFTTLGNAEVNTTSWSHKQWMTFLIVVGVGCLVAVAMCATFIYSN